MLFARDHLGNIDPDQFGAKSVQIPSSDAIDSRFDPWRGKSPGELEVVTIGRGTVPDRPWTSGTAGADRPELGTHPFEVRLDRSRHRWSFSAITQFAAADGIDPSDPLDKDAGAGDERSGATGDGLVSRPDVPPTLRPDGPISPLAWLPAGTAFGTMVHAVLETVDFAASDVHDQVVAEIDRQMAWRSIDLTPVGDAPAGVDGRRLLADGIVAALNTPLGPAWPGLSLRQLGRGDRLNELTFDLRLGGSGGHLQLRDIGHLLVDHLGPDDVLAGWASRLAAGSVDIRLAGHLTGSIDLIFRRLDPSGTERYVVVDYKTNQLTPGAAPRGPTSTGWSGWPRPWPSTTTRCRRSCTPWRFTATCGGACPTGMPGRRPGVWPICSCGAWGVSTWHSATDIPTGCSGGTCRRPVWRT